MAEEVKDRANPRFLFTARLDLFLWLFIFAFKWAQVLSSLRIILLLEKNDIEALFLPQTLHKHRGQGFGRILSVQDASGCPTPTVMDG